MSTHEAGENQPPTEGDVWPPPTFEEAVVCLCGHGLFDHDEYGPCEACVPGGCRAFVGCLVIGGRCG